jgi:hypothetical protein
MMMAKKVGTTFSNSWNTPPNNFNNLCQKKTQNQTSTVEDESKARSIASLGMTRGYFAKVRHFHPGFSVSGTA